MKIENIPCRVARAHDGLLRLYEHDIQPAEDAPCWAFWYGILDLACSQQAIIKLSSAGRDFLIELEDGRAGLVRCVAATSTERFDHAVQDSLRPDEGTHNLLYVIGLTRLAVPEKPALPETSIPRL